MKKINLLLLLISFILFSCKKEEVQPMAIKKVTCCDSLNGKKDSMLFSVTNNSTLEPKTFRLYGGGTTLDAVDDNVDPAFSFGDGFLGFVSNIAIQSDGKMVMVGSFISYNNISANRIVRLNPNGSIDDSFVYGTGFSGATESVAIQSDGKIIVGGGLSSYNGTAMSRVIRLNTDGSVDNSFISGTGFDHGPAAIAIQSDGKILMGGTFTNYNGTAANRIVRLNTDGTIDASFFIGTGFNIGSVTDIAIQSDGKIIISGSYSSYNGTTANKIIRLNSDGSIDNSFAYGTGFNGNVVYSVIIQSDGKVLVGGDFTSYNGTTANRIIRLNTNGSIDNSFTYGSGFNNFVSGISVYPDGGILIGGLFTTYKGVSAIRVIKLNSDGSIDTSFGSGSGFNSVILCLSVQADGKALVGGNFTSYNGTTANRIVRLNPDGSINDTDSEFVTVSVNGGTNTTTEVNSDTLSDPICICKLKIDTDNKDAYNSLLYKKKRSSTGTIESESVSLLSKYTAAQQQGINVVDIDGKEFKECSLDGFNYLEWSVPANSTVSILVTYCQQNRVKNLLSEREMTVKNNKKRYIKAHFNYIFK